MSLKTIKNKIKLNASYSLTLLQSNVQLNVSSSNNNNNNNNTSNNNNNNNNDKEQIDDQSIDKKIINNYSNSMFSNNHDTIIYNNNNSIDSCNNDKSLIKSKSIMGCLNDDDAMRNSRSSISSENSKDLNDDLPSGSCDNHQQRQQQQQRYGSGNKRSKINSISHLNENLLNSSNNNNHGCIRDESVVDDKGNEIIEDENDELGRHIASSESNKNTNERIKQICVIGNRGDNNNSSNNMVDFIMDFDNGMEVKVHDNSNNITTATIPSSSSSTSNENNNEIIMIKKQEMRDDGTATTTTTTMKMIRNEQNNEDERKLLNVNCKRSTNPFLNDDGNMMGADGKLAAGKQQPEAKSTATMSEFDKIIDNTSNNENDDDEQPSGNAEKATSVIDNARLKNHHPHGSSISWIEDYHEKNMLDANAEEEFDSDEFCNSEIFGARDNGIDEMMKQTRLTQAKQERKSSVRSTCDRSTAAAAAAQKQNQCNNLTNDIAADSQLSSSSMKIINNIDHNLIIKSAIPTCKFQRQDYRRPGESDNSLCEMSDGRKCDKKFLKLTKKSTNLFHIPSFSKSNGKMTPSLKHVNLHYPNKTYTSSSALSTDASVDKKYFEKFHSKAKYQLIKLGQKCKILTHHPSSTSTLPLRMGNARTTIIKTNSNHRKKYQYYNEINKSYQLDDFIRATHLLNNASSVAVAASESTSYNNNINNHIIGNDLSHDDIIEYETDGRQNLNNDNCNSVIYKSYKSEIDLTRNLTYLDAFLNEHFERDTSSSIRAAGMAEAAAAAAGGGTEQLTNAIKNNVRRRHQHKRVKSCSKNINYSPNDHNEQIHHQQQMINDINFDGIDESIDDDFRGQQIYDGNITSSSFEYTTPSSLHERKMQSDKRKDMMEIISGKSNTTSSSLSSSDYASVYSSGSKDGRTDAKTKLISTPEESIEYYNTNTTMKHHKHKRPRNGRRSSQPIPEHTNSYQDSETDNFLLFDEANFIELKNNMKKFHPDLYNSVPQFEDLNAIDFFENSSQYDHQQQPYINDDGSETIINPYATEVMPITNKSQLSSSYDDRNIHHKDYLEHYQQQLLCHDDENVETNEYGMKNAFYIPSSHHHHHQHQHQQQQQQHQHQNKIRPRTLTASSYMNQNHNEATRDGYYNPTSSTNDLRYDGRKYTQKTQSQSFGHPHRVIVSKSKKQKGEVVLEYEC